MDMNELALELRKTIIKMNYVSGAGHITSSLSCLEILMALYFGKGKIRYRPDEPLWDGRDYFVLSKGHAAIGYYAVLAKAGFFPEPELWTYCAVGTRLGGHPSASIPGVETASGSLGHGLPFAAGLALGVKMKGADQRVFCMTGDGELQEGSVWEAAMSAAHYGLSNLTLLIDNNDMQLAGYTKDIMNLGDIRSKLSAFGFEVIEIDGHDFGDIDSVLTGHSRKPRAIIAKTVKGHGVPSIENRPDWHGRKPNEDELSVILTELGMAREDLKV
jgi:transketolase